MIHVTKKLLDRQNDLQRYEETAAKGQIVTNISQTACLEANMIVFTAGKKIPFNKSN